MPESPGRIFKNIKSSFYYGSHIVGIPESGGRAVPDYRHMCIEKYSFHSFLTPSLSGVLITLGHALVFYVSEYEYIVYICMYLYAIESQKGWQMAYTYF